MDYSEKRKGAGQKETQVLTLLITLGRPRRKKPPLLTHCKAHWQSGILSNMA